MIAEDTPAGLRAMLAERGIVPRRSMGQNFLIDGNILRIILEAADPAPGEAVLEIGPGAGILTQALLARGCRLLAVEKDRRLADWLRTRFAGVSGLTLIEGDALDLDPAELARRGIQKVVSNLPYGSGTRILVRLLFAPTPPTKMVLLLQSEVAGRLAAGPGDAAYGLLSVWARWRYEPVLLRRIGPRCFLPPPEVESALVRLSRRTEGEGEPVDVEHFRALTRWAFGQRRKQMQTLLRRMPAALGGRSGKSAAALEAAGIAPASRPEDVGVGQWIRLSNRLSNDSGTRPKRAGT